MDGLKKEKEAEYPDGGGGGFLGLKGGRQIGPNVRGGEAEGGLGSVDGGMEQRIKEIERGIAVIR